MDKIKEFLIDLTEGKISDNQIQSIVSNNSKSQQDLERICEYLYAKEKKMLVFVRKVIEAVKYRKEDEKLDDIYTKNIIIDILMDIEHYIQQRVDKIKGKHRIYQNDYMTLPDAYIAKFNQESKNFAISRRGVVTVKPDCIQSFFESIKALISIKDWLYLTHEAYEKIKHFPPSELVRMALSDIFYQEKNWQEDWIENMLSNHERLRLQIVKYIDGKRVNISQVVKQNQRESA